MLAEQRQYGSLKELVQSQLSDLANDMVPGIVVMIPHLKRLDVFTTLGTARRKVDRPFLRKLAWLWAEEKDGMWSFQPIDDERRSKLIADLTLD
tara:strand:+ start:443 stop:724 length:282 start_codon:yes stop_codon:yes gene_type:complete